MSFFEPLMQVFRHQPEFFYLTIVAFGLCIGSFLNVVIYRLPIMLFSQWRNECTEFLSSQPTKEAEPENTTFNLVTPRSRCPKCDTPIGALENIPVLSFLFLKGRCRHCATKISIRYPIVETITAALSFGVAIYFGFSIQTLAALVLTWGLIALTLIDYDHQLLPDNLTLPLLWLGLVLNLYEVFVPIEQAVIGAAFGYLSLWSLYWAYKILTGKEGMGYGDFKLLAVFGAWFGWQLLPVTILLSSFVGAIIGITLIVLKKHQASKPIPFGPYIAIAGWVSMIWGQDLINAYFRVMLPV